MASISALVLAVLFWNASLPHADALRYAAALSAFGGIAIAGGWLFRRKSSPLPPAVAEIPRREDAAFVGDGYEWTIPDAERAVAASSAPWDADRARRLFLPDALLGQHVLILGTTGVGKTRLMELLVLQAIARGDAVAVIDPKGDDRLLRLVRAAARRAGRPFRYFSLPVPHESVRYNPVGEWTQVREVADRLAAVLPATGEAQAFRNFAWEIADTVVRALVAAGEPVTFGAIRRFGIDHPWGLVRLILERRYPKISRPADDARVADIWERSRVEPCPELESMIALARRPREHFLKMASALVPLLAKLASCEPLAPGWSWTQLGKGREVAYFFLGSLLGYETANAVAKMALLDFQSWVGRRYVERETAPVSLFVDELGDVLTPEFVNILNKARGAGIRVTACAQTLSDFEAALGSRARALQVIGNANTVFQFRAQSSEDAEAFSGLGGRRLLRVTAEGEVYEPALFSSGFRGVDDFRASFSKQLHRIPLDVVPPWAVLDLPTFHYYARWGGRIQRGVCPVVGEGTNH